MRGNESLLISPLGLCGVKLNAISRLCSERTVISTGPYELHKRNRRKEFTSHLSLKQFLKDFQLDMQCIHTHLKFSACSCIDLHCKKEVPYVLTAMNCVWMWILIIEVRGFYKSFIFCACKRTARPRLAFWPTEWQGVLTMASCKASPLLLCWHPAALVGREAFSHGLSNLFL